MGHEINLVGHKKHYKKKETEKYQSVYSIRLVLLLETFTSADFSVVCYWVPVYKEDYRQKSLKAMDLRYFRKFISFRASLNVT